MTDHFNSQPLVPGAGIFQTSFGFGSDDGDALNIPPIFIPDEEVHDGPDDVRASPVGKPKICGVRVISEESAEPRTISLGTVRRPGPRIGSIKIVDDD